MSDHMDLLVEQVKMLAGEIAFSTSTLKRLVEQSANDPESSRSQVILISFPRLWVMTLFFFIVNFYMYAWVICEVILGLLKLSS